MNSTLRHYALWFFGVLTLTLTPLLQGQTKQPLDLETVTYGGKTFRSLFYPQPVYGLAWLQSGYTYTVEPEEPTGLLPDESTGADGPHAG